MTSIKRCTAIAGAVATFQDVFSPLDAWPIGSVYIGTTATNPSSLLGGGTWTSFGTGRVLIGRDAADTTMDSAEELGGAKTHTLGAANLPIHAHDIDHAHAAFNSGANNVGHTHTINHDHPTVTTSSNGSHSHLINANNSPTSLSTGNLGRSAGGTATTFPTDTEAAHTHTLDVPLSTGLVSGSPNQGHLHSISVPASTGLVSGNGPGTATAVNHMPPFIVVYMWKRVA